MKMLSSWTLERLQNELWLLRKIEEEDPEGVPGRRAWMEMISEEIRYRLGIHLVA